MLVLYSVLWTQVNSDTLLWGWIMLHKHTLNFRSKITSTCYRAYQFPDTWILCLGKKNCAVQRALTRTRILINEPLLLRQWRNSGKICHQSWPPEANSLVQDFRTEKSSSNASVFVIWWILNWLSELLPPFEFWKKSKLLIKIT